MRDQFSLAQNSQALKWHHWKRLDFVFLRVHKWRPNVDDNPISKHDNKTVHCVPPGKDHDSSWLFEKKLNNYYFASEKCF
jgi:hypothetical protein